MIRYLGMIVLAGIAVAGAASLVFGDRDVMLIVAALAAVWFGLPLLDLAAEYWGAPPDIIIENEER